ncbi:MAG TPA: tetratricopeptide repeat protein [Candidatus Acidoferrales bacterium]|nr:tetratricopeptide repeat protein [Candidatus Acidoferrales bacterium]
MAQAEDQPNKEAKTPTDNSGRPAKAESWTLSRETTLVFAAGVLIAFFAVTAFASRFYHETQRSLARHWHDRGQSALAAGRAAEAVEDLRTALVYSHGNGDQTGASDRYEFELATALASDGKFEEARAYLVNAAERMPGDAEVNLELARLASRENRLEEAARDYNAAIFGAWRDNAAERRRAARIEYFEFLLSHGERAEAQAQAIAIAGALPADADLYVTAGNLLLRSGEYDQALVTFQRSLSLRRTAEGFRGAGIAAFRLGNYREAERYLADAARFRVPEQDVRDLLGSAQLVVALDPFNAGLSVAERAKRASQDFAAALKRLDACAEAKVPVHETGPVNALRQLQDQMMKVEPLASESHLRTHPDDLNSVMLAVFSVETGMPQQCGPAQGADAALQLIAKNRSGIVQP